MISLTKVFRFEAAHALHSHPGACAHVHGHSYELHVTIQSKGTEHGYIDGLGIVFDFKDLKKVVADAVNTLDHKLMLSNTYLKNVHLQFDKEELVVFEHEPTAENLLIFFRDRIKKGLPETVSLLTLKLWETSDSYAEWTDDESYS